MVCIRCKSEIDKTFRACPHCGEPVTEFIRRYTDELLDGKYRIVERLGAGGMGEVYLAEHTYLGSMRVIKVIRAQISESRDAHDRFLREARAATKVQHQNVATMHDFSALPDGSHYMVWEYIDGENLAQRLRARGPMAPRLAVRVAIQALHGLEAVHRAGIVHRDISPENIMVTRDSETVKIIDLGVAKFDDPSDISATRTGIFVGKLRYASPEQLGFLEEGEKIDARADLYSLGMVLYEMLEGRPPFEATSPHQYYILHSQEKQFQPLELPADLPGGQALQAALQRALARNRNHRFASARDFALALEEVERSLPNPAAMPTMAVPLDGDATMRVTPMPEGSRQTVRTSVAPAPAPEPPAQPTLRTPLPMRTASEPIRKPQPPRPAAPPQARDGSAKALFAVLGILGVAALAFAVWWLTRDKPGQPQAQIAAAATTTTAAPVPAETSLDVTTTTAVTETAPETTTTATAPPPVTTTTVAPPPTATREERPQRPQQAAQPAPSPDERLLATPVTPPPVVEERPAAGNVAAYIENGDEDANDAVMERLRDQLRGTTRIALRGGANDPGFQRVLRNELPSLQIDPSAEVAIWFDGNVERLGRGRKARSGTAVIAKNGRPIFRYSMPREEYRVGATPAEAFVGILSDALD